MPSLLGSLACFIGLTQSVMALQGDPNKFRNDQDEIRKLEREVSNKYASIPVGFSEELKKAMEEIEAMKQQVTLMRTQLDASAIESFTAGPDQNPHAAQHIVNMGMACLEGRGRERPFDPARTYELASLLGKGGKPAPQVLNMAYQACLALQDFERGERLLKRIAGMGATIPESVTLNLNKHKKAWAKELAKRELEQQGDDLPRVKLETDMGDIIVELFEDECPATVANFVYLVESGFFDGTDIYEVRPSLVARAGCPKGDGKGDPGYRIANEPSSSNSRRFFAGTIGMQHNGANTAGSQFFFTYQPKPDYDLNYVAFGRIVEGLEVLYQLPITLPTSSQFATNNATKIKKATVLRKRDHAYEPDKIEPLPTSSFETEMPGTETPATDLVPSVEGGAVPDVAPPDDGTMPDDGAPSVDVAPSDDGTPTDDGG